MSEIMKTEQEANMQYLQEVESQQKISVTGKQRFVSICKYLERSVDRQSIRTIYDIGGTKGTKLLFERLFPNAKVTVYNMDMDEIKNEADFHFLDIEKEAIPQKYDLIFAGEIIEHLLEPFDSVQKMVEALHDNGLLLLTTPNIANLYNRFFLLFGFALGNYYPTMRYRLGNPFLDKGDGIYSGSHKSLFNWRGIKELLALLHLDIVYAKGYSYFDFQPISTKQEMLFAFNTPCA